MIVLKPIVSVIVTGAVTIMVIQGLVRVGVRIPVRPRLFFLTKVQSTVCTSERPCKEHTVSRCCRQQPTHQPKSHPGSLSFTVQLGQGLTGGGQGSWRPSSAAAAASSSAGCCDERPCKEHTTGCCMQQRPQQPRSHLLLRSLSWHLGQGSWRSTALCSPAAWQGNVAIGLQLRQQLSIPSLEARQ